MLQGIANEIASALRVREDKVHISLRPVRSQLMSPYVHKILLACTSLRLEPRQGPGTTVADVVLHPSLDMNASRAEDVDVDEGGDKSRTPLNVAIDLESQYHQVLPLLLL